MMDWCFKQLNLIVTNRMISNRVCFLIEHLIEMRNRKWVECSLGSSNESSSTESEDKLVAVGQSFMDESSLSNLESSQHFAGKHRQ
jgi:hypothetical protein